MFGDDKERKKKCLEQLMLANIRKPESKRMIVESGTSDLRGRSRLFQKKWSAKE